MHQIQLHVDLLKEAHDQIMKYNSSISQIVVAFVLSYFSQTFVSNPFTASDLLLCYMRPAVIHNISDNLKISQYGRKATKSMLI